MESVSSSSRALTELKLMAQSGLRFSPRIVPACAIIVFALTNQFIALRFIVYYLLSELAVLVIKKGASSALGGAFPGLIHRPSGAGGCEGCGTTFRPDVHKCINADNEIGMPSGHALTLAMAATFWILWLWRQSKLKLPAKIAATAFMALVALVVAASRSPLYERCHSYPQVTVGLLAGVALGAVFYKLETTLTMKYPNGVGRQ